MSNVAKGTKDEQIRQLSADFDRVQDENQESNEALAECEKELAQTQAELEDVLVENELLTEIARTSIEYSNAARNWAAHGIQTILTQVGVE